MQPVMALLAINDEGATGAQNEQADSSAIAGTRASMAVKAYYSRCTQ